MKYDFYRDFYYLMFDSIKNNSVTFLLGTRKCGKTVCLHQLNDTLSNAKYIDFKTIPSYSEKIQVFENVFNSIRENEDIIYLLDEITYVLDAEVEISKVAGMFSEHKNNNTKIVFTGSQSVSLEAWANRAFAGNASKISVDFLTYSEFLRYKGLDEINPNTYNQFLYEVADFYKFTSLENYLKGCMEETIISNHNATNYIYNNECDLIEDNVDILINICYQTMFTLHNHVGVETFFRDNKLRDSIIRDFQEACLKIGDETIAKKIENSFIGSYSNIKSQNLKVLKQAFVFLKKCDLITITPITDSIDDVPDVYRAMRIDDSDIDCKKDLFKKFNITINHPMFYVQILKDILKEDMPIELPKAMLGSIVECYARGMLPNGFEYHSTDEQEQEIDYVDLTNMSAVEFTISNKHNKYFYLLPNYIKCTCLTRDINKVENNVTYVDYCSYLYMLSKNKYLSNNSKYNREILSLQQNKSKKYKQKIKKDKNKNKQK